MRRHKALTILVLAHCVGCERSLPADDGGVPQPPDARVNDLFEPELVDLGGDGDISLPDLARRDGLTMAFKQLEFDSMKQPLAVGVGDFDADGRPDVVLAGMGTEVAFHRNLGGPKPSIELLKSVPIQRGPVAAGLLAVGDFNGDRHIDVVVCSVASPANLSVLLGAGTFEFQEVTTALPADPVTLQQWDFDEDGLPDLAIRGSTPGMTSLLLLRNLGGGRFAQAATFSVSAKAGWPALGDLNADGHTDLVLPHGTDVSVFLGKGGFDFEPPKTYPLGPIGGLSALVGQFDDDPNLDVLVTSDSLGFLRGDGIGGLALKYTFAIGPSAWLVAAVDFDRDGISDAVVRTGDIGIMRGAGAGRFLPPQTFKFGSTAYSVALADFDADGKLDVAGAVYFRNSLVVLWNTSK